MHRLLAALALALSPLSAHAVPLTEPIVFDFEDGLQGWELHGTATRVQTQVLGGEWAIFGDGVVAPVEGVDPMIPTFFDLGTSMSMTVGLSSVASVTVEFFFVEGNEQSLALGQGGFVSDLFLGRFFPFVALDPERPNLLSVDLTGSSAMSTRTVSAPVIIIRPEPPDPVESLVISWSLPAAEASDPSVVAFIDNITFHPVPEPGTLALLTVGLVVLLIGRRRIV